MVRECHSAGPRCIFLCLPLHLDLLPQFDSCWTSFFWGEFWGFISASFWFPAFWGMYCPTLSTVKGQVSAILLLFSTILGLLFPGLHLFIQGVTQVVPPPALLSRGVTLMVPLWGSFITPDLNLILSALLCFLFKNIQDISHLACCVFVLAAVFCKRLLLTKKIYIYSAWNKVVLRPRLSLLPQVVSAFHLKAVV